MRITDQPGRVLVITVLAPVLYTFKHLLLADPLRHSKWIAQLLGQFAIIFALYELFWLCKYPPKVTYV